MAASPAEHRCASLLARKFAINGMVVLLLNAVLLLTTGASRAQQCALPPLEAGRLLGIPATSNVAYAHALCLDSTLWTVPYDSSTFARYTYDGTRIATCDAPPQSHLIQSMVCAGPDAGLLQAGQDYDSGEEVVNAYSPLGRLRFTTQIPGGGPISIAVGPDSLLWVLNTNEPPQLCALSLVDGSVRRQVAVTLTSGTSGAWLVAITDNYEFVLSCVSSEPGIRAVWVDSSGASRREVQFVQPLSKYSMVYGGRSGSLMMMPRFGAARILRFSPLGSLQDSVALSVPARPSWLAFDDFCHLVTNQNGQFHAYIEDLDRDGICDSWEVFGLPAGMGVANWVPPNSCPKHKNVYLGYDVMAGCSPVADVLNRVVDYLAHIPNEKLVPPNQDGGAGIRLSVDTLHVGALARGFLDYKRSDQRVIWSEVDSIRQGGRDTQFSLVERRSRARVEHYALFADGFRPGPVEFGVRGLSRGIPGRDMLFLIGSINQNQYLADSLSDSESGALLHELGHGLGLRHGGSDDNIAKPNYHSVMNYMYTARNPLFRVPWKLLLSSDSLPPLDEYHLVDADGIGISDMDSIPVGPTARYADPDHCKERYDPVMRLQMVPAHGPVDWDCNSVTAWAPRIVHNVSPSWGSPEPTVLWGADDMKLLHPPTAAAALRARGNTTAYEDDSQFDVGYVGYASAAKYLDRNGNGLADGDDIEQHPEWDSDGDWQLDVYQPSRVSLLKEAVVLCPAGDAESLVVQVSLEGLRDAWSALRSGRIWGQLVSRPEEEIEAFARVGGLWGKTDSIGLVVSDSVTMVSTLALTRASGCGAAVVRVFVDGQQLPDTARVTIKSLDCDGHVTGAVDSRDSAAVRTACVGGGACVCGDLNGDGVGNSLDVAAVVAHLWHHAPRQVHMPNGGETYTPDSSVAVTWSPSGGDSGRVSVSLTRDGVGGWRQVLAGNVPDTGRVVCSLAQVTSSGSDYRIVVEHTAGVWTGANGVGADSSDGHITITVPSSGGGGCPIVDVGTALGWSRENSILGITATNSMGLDAYRLVAAPLTSAGTVQLRIHESEDELSQVDELRLIAVDHDSSRSVFAAGERVALGTVVPASRVTDQAGHDVSGVLRPGSAGYVGSAGDTLTIELRPSGTAGALSAEQVLTGGTLVLNAFEKPPIDDLRNRPDGPTGAMSSEAFTLSTSGILIQVPGGNDGWVTLAHTYPRQYEAPILCDSVSANTYRLVFLGEHHLTFVGRLEEVADSLRASKLPLLGATHSRLGDVLGAVSTLGNLSTSLARGDTLGLEFAATPVPAGLVRDYFLLSRGAYTYNLPARSTPMSSPKLFRLYQNRPNPFRRGTEFRFDLPSTAKVHLEIFDPQGRRVRSLADRRYSPGTYSVPWDQRDDAGSLVAPGVYLYRLQAGAYRDQKKLVVLP